MNAKTSLLSANPNSLYRLPNGLDLRASGPDFHNHPATLGFSTSGEAFLKTKEKIVLLGSLTDQRVELGWTITGFRLRGALRLPKRNLVLTIPDREDLPYLLRALLPTPESSAASLAAPTALVA